MRSAVGPSSGQKRNHGGPIFSHDRLMQASEECLSKAARSGTPIEQIVAHRIFDNPTDFSRWECQHAGLLRRVFSAGAVEAQKFELLSASLTLVHRKALFEYLRASGIRGTARERLMRHFFRQADYTRSIVVEHGNYLRSAASFLCSSYIGARFLVDEIFDEPLLEYEQLYWNYFQVYCQLATSEADHEAAVVMEPLLASLKTQVCDWRRAILALAHSRSGIWRPPAQLLGVNGRRRPAGQ